AFKQSRFFLVYGCRRDSWAGHAPAPHLTRGARSARPHLVDGSASSAEFRRKTYDSSVSLFFSDAVSASVDRQSKIPYCRRSRRLHVAKKFCARKNWRLGRDSKRGD